MDWSRFLVNMICIFAVVTQLAFNFRDFLFPRLTNTRVEKRSIQARVVKCQICYTLTSAFYPQLKFLSLLPIECEDKEMKSEKNKKVIEL